MVSFVTLSSCPVSRIANQDRDIVPLTVYMPDSDLEDVSDHHDRVRAPSHPLSLLLLAGRYTAASFTDVPNEWLA